MKVIKKLIFLVLLLDIALGGYIIQHYYIESHETMVYPDSNDGDVKIVALTFDDGPHPVYTPKLLDGLKERNVKATFFMIGESMERYPDVVKRVAEEGHLIGNHTYSHVQLTKISQEKACIEIEKTNKVIFDLTGKVCEFIRPPFGSWNKKYEDKYDLIPVMWNVDPRDWNTTNTQAVVKSVLKNVDDGDIILLHDEYESSVDAALKIVDELQKKGYVFVTVDQLVEP